MRTLVRVLAIVGCVLLLPLQAVATDQIYYVDNQLPGSNSNSGTTEAAPLLTVQYCMTTKAIQPGDSCLVKNGNYDLSGGFNLTASGTSGHPITLKAYPGHAPVFFSTDFSNTANQIQFANGTGWINVEGITAHDMYYFVHLTYVHDVIIRNNTVYDSYEPVQGKGTNVTIDRNVFYHTRNPGIPAGGGCCYAIYLGGQNLTITRNVMYDIISYCLHIRGDATESHGANYAGWSGTFSHNTCAYTETTAGSVWWTNGASPGQMTARIENNIFYQSNTDNNAASHAGIRFLDIGTGANRIVRGNVIYNSNDPTGAAAIHCSSSSTGTHDDAWCNSNGWIDSSGGNSKTTNPNLANATLTLPASPDFTLTASSTAAINTGVVISGMSYNGSAPDVGAFETFVFSTCSIANGTPGVINATFTNNVNPPLLPLSGVTTFTARKATVADTVTGVTRTGDNQLDIAVQNNYANGNAADISWASGNLTDSALIGGTLNQPYVETLTNQSCTNNVGGSPSFLFIQAAYEWHGLRGTEAAPVLLRSSGGATENLAIKPVPGGKARLRIALTCSTADCPATGFYPYYACAACTTAGTYTQIPDSFAADEDIAFCGNDADPDIPTSGASTTDQLSTSGTCYDDPICGAFVRTNNAIPTVTMATGEKAELEYCLAWDTDAVAGRVYTIRIYKQDGTAIDTYTNTAQATITSTSMGSGF